MSDNENWFFKLLNTITTKRGGFLGLVTLLLVLLLAGNALDTLPAMLKGDEAFWILFSILVVVALALVLSFVFESRKQADKKLLNITVYVLDDKGKGISSASVTLRGLSANTKKTDSNGEVVFANLPGVFAEQNLELFAEKSGLSETIDIPATTLQSTYRLTLKK